MPENQPRIASCNGLSPDSVTEAPLAVIILVAAPMHNVEPFKLLRRSVGGAWRTLKKTIIEQSPQHSLKICLLHTGEPRDPRIELAQFRRGGEELLHGGAEASLCRALKLKHLSAKRRF